MADEKGKSVQTTGHAWDGDLQEFNNPLPRWWLWSFYGTVVFAIIYWLIYPAWPIADSYTKGFGTVSYQSGGKEVTRHWNTRAELLQDLQSGSETLKQQAYLQKVAAASYDDIANDPEMSAFTQSMAKVLFADNCAACHGIGGSPARIGQYPNLRDDAWLWGGDIAQIEQTIEQGRNGFMPAFGEVLGDAKIEQVASYVLGLSGHQVDAAKAEAGRAIFQGQEGGCFYCHTTSGKGLPSQGAANLTDAIWTVADVPGAATDADRLKAVEAVIREGIQRQMPGWKGRLSTTEIKLLTAYVHSLGS
ncbi:MAG: cytochrome-c oxidase, cbb3-type subunit III [Chromatiaceae bacterium]|nr:cytochrome-c oxidase, cbb3-type subunit III [Gammaproteobacteria bacterium]MCP5300124.1 cytochrome-c oxidase, cbb3-type subunit III [Chromatiaceae bacterium]MCP5422196.1 cytochrome-c oxidase, cbb3-type subunit III [Chromatiaceae bacterium]